MGLFDTNFTTSQQIIDQTNANNIALAKQAQQQAKTQREAQTALFGTKFGTDFGTSLARGLGFDETYNKALEAEKNLAAQKQGFVQAGSTPTTTANGVAIPQHEQTLIKAQQFEDFAKTNNSPEAMEYAQKIREQAVQEKKAFDASASDALGKKNVASYISSIEEDHPVIAKAVLAGMPIKDAQKIISEKGKRGGNNLENVGGALYNTDTGEWITPPPKGVALSTTPIKTINANGDNVTQLVGEDGSVYAEFAAQEGGQSVNMEKLQQITLNQGFEATRKINRITQTQAMFDKLPEFGGGLPQTFESLLKDNAGLRDAKSAAITAAKGIRASEAMNYLPPGPASDKDVALALAGQPPENAKSAEWNSWLRGVKKLAQFEEDYYRDKDAFISNNGNQRGFGQFQEHKKLSRAISELPTLADGRTPLDVYNNTPPEQKEQMKKFFKDKYGFDPDREGVLRGQLGNLGLL